MVVLSEPQEVSIGSLVASLLERSPHKTAIVDKDRTISNKELHLRAQTLCRKLINAGVEREDIVGIITHHGSEHIIAQLAVVYAGGSCLPLDPSLSETELQSRVAFTNPKYFLFSKAFRTRVPASCQMFLVDVKEPIDNASQHDITVRSQHRTHILFSSGTTGTPKAVQVPGCGILGLAVDDVWDHTLGNTRIGHVNSTSFDASLIDIWVTLLRGATIVVIDRQDLLSPHTFATTLKEMQITTLTLTAAHFKKIAAFCPGAFSKLNMLLLGGERPSALACREVLRHSTSSLRLVNGYGPTECTVMSLLHEITNEDLDHDRMPLGRLVYQTDAYILDEDMKQVTGAGSGELFLGGPGLSLGYLFDDEKTSKAFIRMKDPKDSSRIIRLYRTNDIIKIHQDGYMTWVGRKNREIKLAGHRINLDLVESELTQTQLVNNAVAVKFSCPILNTDYLAACVIYKHNEEDHDTLFKEAKKRLPLHMVPRLITFDELPLNNNGKIDHEKTLEKLKNMMQARHVRITAANTPDFQNLSRIEKYLKQIWAEILISIPTEAIDKHSNFFHLGASSSDVTTLLGRIQESFDVSLPVRAVFENPLLDEQAQAIDKGDDVAASLEKVKMAMQSDAEKYSSAINVPDRGNVLLTGATGFVAPFLMQELLQVPDIKAIYCLVRADTHRRGVERLSSTFEQYGLDFDSPKIKVILGDFTLPELGLDKTTYNKLASSISAVYHLGALVDYNQPYSTHRKANVLGTFHMLEFASAQRVKNFHYVSSLAAFGPTGLVAKHSMIAEDDSLEPYLEHSLPYEGGYGQSQWVADEMVARVMRRGFPAAIYRLGFVLCHSVSGMGNPNDFMSRLLSDCAELGVYPIMPDQRKELISVDNVAKIIKTIAISDRNLGHAYHIASGLERPINMDDTFRLLVKLGGVEMRALPYPEWIELLQQANKAGKSLRIRALLPVLGEKVYDGKTRWQVYEGMANFRVDNTLRALRDAGESEDLLSPVSNAAYEKYLFNCLRIKGDSTG